MDNYPGQLIPHMAKPTSGDSKRFFVVGVAMFVIAIGLLCIRLIVYHLPTSMDEMTIDIIFSVLVQICILLLTTFFIYKFALKMKTREVLAFSNCNKTKWYNCLLAVPLGVVGLFVTVGVSTVWLVFLMVFFGYAPTSTPVVYPLQFDMGIFLLQLTLTALLPAICEEFAMRGGLFSVMRRSYRGIMLYVVMAVAFGLFHQNIRQVFYTALFGGAMAFLLVKTKSIWPCVIVHFVNNGLSVYLDYAEQYGWLGGKILPSIYLGLTENLLVLFLAFVAFSAAYVGLLFLFHYLNCVKVLKAKKETILDSGFNHTQGRVVLVGAEDPDKVRELQLEQEVYGKKLPANLYKPTLKEAMFYIGAIVTAGLFTLFSFLFGMFY